MLDKIVLNHQNHHDFFQLFSRTFQNTSYQYPFTQEDFMQNLAGFGINEAYSFILTDNENEIGILLAGKNGRTAYLSYLAILPEYRKKGYGTRLLNEGLTLLSSECDQVVLDVLQQNHSAILLYQNRGFNKVREIVNLRNEKNSFFSLFKNKSFTVTREDELGFPIMYHHFVSEKPWLRSQQLLTKRLHYNCEYYLVRKNKKSIGYLVIMRKMNHLNILDMGLEEKYYEHFSAVISQVLKGENIVQANSFYIDDPLCECFLANGFYVDSLQYEMKRGLS